ncbi:MAG TPA: cytochrome c oxidase assembly factor Coa1 family protein [Pyrinomonadaceae bacterium]|jgi:archaellum component FlaG (FlaF/FlaG flagellin family)|nr:cytochrome c oxidase assembly factor Coa1 family protein [Pyrinomonadaceae bacterium]
MTTKKIVQITGGVVVALIVLTLVFVLAIVGFGLYTVTNSELADKAKDYLRKNEKLKQDIGEVKDFGNIVQAAINDRDGNSEVTLKLKVIGERKTVNATVDLVLVQGNAWRVTSASYVNSSGQKIPLLDPYDTKVTKTPIPSLTT